VRSPMLAAGARRSGGGYYTDWPRAARRNPACAPTATGRGKMDSDGVRGKTLQDDPGAGRLRAFAATVCPVCQDPAYPGDRLLGVVGTCQSAACAA